MKKIIFFFSILIFITLWGGYDFLNSPAGGDESSIFFEVAPGPVSRIPNRLHKQGLIKNDRIYRWYLKLTGNFSSIKVGEYELKKTMSPLEITKILKSGISVAHKITFQEGLNIFEMGDLLDSKGFAAKKDFLDLVTDKKFVSSLLGENRDSLEGYLYPDTYQFSRSTPVKKIIQAMYRQFLEKFEEAKLESVINWNRHRIVTLASIIEKETGAPWERRTISSVFHNRMNKKMRLQTDPTIIYGKWVETGERLRNIRRKHLTEKNDYNTYAMYGLPKGPISNPGFESLKAAMNPETSEYLYFVSQNDGTHKFSNSYKEHLKAVKEYQLNRKARKGKSWRDLNKKSKNR